MHRFDIINHLIRLHGFQSYLEIGVLGRETFNQVDIPLRHGVDPNGAGDFAMTSDEFFERHCNRDYDIIFIDGLHLSEQVEKDIGNSLTHLNKGGIIVVHDCLPTEEYQQRREAVSGKPWTGDVWKAFAKMRAERYDLKMCVVDTDYGCGLIWRDGFMNTPISYHPIDGEYTWDFFCKNRDKIMGVISVEEFLGHSQ